VDYGVLWDNNVELIKVIWINKKEFVINAKEKEMDMNKSNKRFWERFAFIYTGFMKKNAMVYDELCRRIRKHLSYTDSVLELACGTGQLTLQKGYKSCSI
jgi:ubiquinone/menaquinone biosynthesis C-methylase UbiE